MHVMPIASVGCGCVLLLLRAANRAAILTGGPELPEPLPTPRLRQLLDNGHTIDVSRVFSGDRFYVLSVGMTETHLLLSGVFEADGQPAYGPNQRLLVKFDGGSTSFSRPTDVLGIGNNGCGLTCLNSLDPLGGDFIDLRPAKQRQAHNVYAPSDGAGASA